MADEPSLPRLAWNSTTESFSNDRAHKRVRLESPIISSDPALFSSDDDPSSENYTQGRRKRTYRGPWYSQRPALDQDLQESQINPKKSKRTFERQFDSGVWLGSDGTDFDETEGLQTNNETWNLPMRQSRATQTKDEPPSPEELARKQIELCLEDGNESIDLSYVTRTESRLSANRSPQISRSNTSFKCNYPTAYSILLRTSCHRGRFLPNRTHDKDIPRLE